MIDAMKNAREALTEYYREDAPVVALLDAAIVEAEGCSKAYGLLFRENANLRAAIQQAESADPSAWRAMNCSGNGDQWSYRDADDRFVGANGEPTGEPLYTHPAPDSRDAERYRMLRDGSGDKTFGAYVFEPIELCNQHWIDGDNLDKIIDAAIAKEGK